MKSSIFQNKLAWLIAGLLILNLWATLTPSAIAIGSRQYKAVQGNVVFDQYQAILDQMASQGWEFAGSVNSIMIFKK